MDLVKKKKIACGKCGVRITEKSAFVVHLFRSQDGYLLHDVVKSITLDTGSVCTHLPADRQCTKPMPGFKKKIAELLGISHNFDMEFLD